MWRSRAVFLPGQTNGDRIPEPSYLPAHSTQHTSAQDGRLLCHSASWLLLKLEDKLTYFLMGLAMLIIEG